MKNNNDSSVILLKNYGHIRIKLNEIIKQKEISRNKVARLIGSRFEVIDKWYDGTVEKIDADILARLCYVLECEVEDLIEYVKPLENTFCLTIV